MKFAKRIFSLFMVLMAVAYLLIACSPKNSGEGTCKIVVATEPAVVYTVNIGDVTGGQNLLTALAYLREKDGLTYAESGGMLTAVGGLSQDAATGVYLYLYTTVTQDQDVSVYATTVEYDGQTLISSGVGAAEMHLEDGAVIYIGTIVYN